MGQPNFRVIDPQRDHPRDLAKRAIKEFRLDRDNPDKPLPIVNATTHSGAPLLIVNEVIERTQRELPKEQMRARYKVNPEFFIKAVLIILMLSGLVLLVNSMR